MALSSSSFLPHPKRELFCIRKRTATSSFSLPPMRTPQRPVLDVRAPKQNPKEFARRLRSLLLSKPNHSISLAALSCSCVFLNPPPPASLLSMIELFPDLFALCGLTVGLTPSAADLSAEESRLRSSIADALAGKLHRLLMLAHSRRILLSKLARIATDLGLSPNFSPRICWAHPARFRPVRTCYGPALELVSWDHSLAEPVPHLEDPTDDLRRPIIARRVPRFPQLRLRPGFNLKAQHRLDLIRFQSLPEVNPYEIWKAGTAKMDEKRACAVVREVLAMMRKKRTLVDNLKIFRKDFGLPNQLRKMLLKHREMFRVGGRGNRNSVLLVEFCDRKRRVVVEDELISAKERLIELLREVEMMMGGRTRRARVGQYEVEEEEEEEEGRSFDDELVGFFEDEFGKGSGETMETDVSGEPADPQELDDMPQRKELVLASGLTVVGR